MMGMRLLLIWNYMVPAIVADIFSLIIYMFDKGLHLVLFPLQPRSTLTKMRTQWLMGGRRTYMLNQMARFIFIGHEKLFTVSSFFI